MPQVTTQRNRWKEMIAAERKLRPANPSDRLRQRRVRNARSEARRRVWFGVHQSYRCRKRPGLAALVPGSRPWKAAYGRVRRAEKREHAKFVAAWRRRNPAKARRQTRAAAARWRAGNVETARKRTREAMRKARARKKGLCVSRFRGQT